MLAEYKTQSNVLIVLGLIGEVVAFFVDGNLAIPVRVIARVLIIVGCFFYAKGKGYSGAWGLLGLLSILGLIILICMRDRRKELVRCSPSRVVFQCPNCSGGMEYNGVLHVGQKVQCPHCLQNFVINHQTQEAQIASGTEGSAPETKQWHGGNVTSGGLSMSEFAVRCPGCGSTLMASEEYVGQKVKCPDCDLHFVIAHCNGTECGGQSDAQNTMLGMGASDLHNVPTATVALMVVNILATILLFGKTGSIEPDAQSCVEYGANFKLLTLGGQWWRLVTSAFIHFDIKHLVMNMLCLYSVGSLLERLIGHAKTVELYLLTAITGSLASCVFHPNVVCAGASGAVFGLFGAQITYIMILRERLGLTSKALGGYMKSGLVFIAINFAYGLMPGVDMAAHVGGLLGGLLIGAVIALSVSEGNGGDVVTSRIISGISILVALGLAISLVTGRNAGRLSVSRLTAQVSQMLIDNLNKDNGKDGGSFEVTNLSLTHGTGSRYYGDVEMAFKCGGKTYPLKSRIEVMHDAMKTAYELNKDDFEAGLAGLQNELRQVSIEELKSEVSRIFIENMTNGLKKEGCKNVLVSIERLSLTHDMGNRYHGRIEALCRYDGEIESLKSRIDVTFDGETIAYELKAGD